MDLHAVRLNLFDKTRFTASGPLFEPLTVWWCFECEHLRDECDIAQSVCEGLRALVAGSVPDSRARCSACYRPREQARVGFQGEF